MEVVLNYKDGDVEVIKNVKSIHDRDAELWLRDMELHAIRYAKSDIRSVDIVWR